MRRWVLSLLVIGGAACGGGTPPQLSDLTTSSRRAQIGSEVFLSAQLFDPDGDLHGGRLVAGIRSVDSDQVDLQGESPILGFENARTRGEVIVGLQLLGAVGEGEYEVSLQAEDGAGDRSEPLRDTIRYSF